MKKFLSLILALAIVACMSVIALAADGTTILTVEIPLNEPSYTLHFPANMTLEYGNTDKQTVGELYVTDVENTICIWCYPKYTDLINTADQNDTISLTLFDYYVDSYKAYEKDGRVVNQGVSQGAPQLYWKDKNSDLWENGYTSHSIAAQISDWSAATPGATYQATITYTVTHLK